VGIEHAHGVRAPAPRGTRGGGQGLFEARVAHGEVLGTGIKAAEGAGRAGHATADFGVLLEQAHFVAGLHQGARAGDAGHAGADDGDAQAC
jgi:hypothetical protein